MVGTRSTRLGDVTVRSDGNVLAVATIEYRKHYPLWNFSGWGTGVPKLSGKKTRIFIYDLKKDIIEEKATVRFPKAWNQAIKVRLYTFDDNGGLYLILTGCPTSDQNCDNRKYYYVSASGTVDETDQLPTPGGQYASGPNKKVATVEFDGKISRIKIGTLIGKGSHREWEYVLSYDGKTGFTPLRGHHLAPAK